MALDRVVELSIGSNGQGLLISDLDIDFKITKSLTFSDNFATFTIYNVKPETRNTILKPGNNIIFKAGYKDEAINTIFIGNIAEVNVSKGFTDNEVKILAYTGRGFTGKERSSYISLSFTPGTLLTQPLQQLASLYSLVIYGAENAQIKLTNGWSYAGKVSGAFRYISNILKSNGCGMYKDDKELIIFKEGATSKISVVVLSYAGGLKSIENISDNSDLKKEKVERTTSSTTKKKKNIITKPTEAVRLTKYKFESLIIPQCQINSVVQIVTPEVSGFFTVEKLEYEGNNYGGSFNMTGEVFL